MENIATILNIFSALALIIAVGIVYMLRRSIDSAPLKTLFYLLVVYLIAQIHEVAILAIANTLSDYNYLIRIISRFSGFLPMAFEYIFEFKLLESVQGKKDKKLQALLYCLIILMLTTQSYLTLAQILEWSMAPFWVTWLIQTLLGATITLLAIKVILNARESSQSLKTVRRNTGLLYVMFNLGIFLPYGLFFLNLIPEKAYEICRNISYLVVFSVAIIYAQRFAILFKPSLPSKIKYY